MVSAETPWAEWMVVAYPRPVELADVVGGQSDGEVAAGVPDCQVAVVGRSG